ncbi:cornifelin [Pseudorasbora parva]|uniref:cornifelin n=1 Tax=Pseudorasbora parva TaxID=51549 RepID=UPI00351E85FD
MAAVIVQQPYTKSNGAWSSGICDCGQDLNSCCYAFWCFPCFACSTTGEFGESTCLPLLDLIGPVLMASFGVPACVPPVTLGMRVAVRYKYDIGVSFPLPLPIKETGPQFNNLFVLQQGSLCEDIMLSCCCIWCSWCQMSREIKARKQTVTIYQTAPMFQPIPMATTTQVVSTQQSFEVVRGPPAAVASGMQTAPTQTYPPMGMTDKN